MPRFVIFVAKDIGTYEDYALIVGFARDQRDEQTDEALILQRAKEGDDDDTGVYAEIPPQRFATFDGVERAILGPDSLIVRFGPDAWAELDDISEMRISFTMRREEFSSVAAMLERIFRDHEGFRIDQG
jgi:hypothetical protein